MGVSYQNILDEYSAHEKTYEVLRAKVLDVLKDAVNRSGIVAAGIEGRVKEKNSLEKKLELKGSKYSSISDITDIVGCRVITFYSDEVDRVSALIEGMFDIDWENSVDKRKILLKDQFGYMSVHYICRIPESIYCSEKFPELNSIRFEIQVRTALQHVWATIYHDTGYKSDIEVPKEYLRGLVRLAGLMEIADEEFRSIRDDIDSYRGKIRNLIQDRKFDDIELNGDSFRDYLALDPFEKITKGIAGINKSELQPANMFSYLEILKHLQMKSLGDVEKMKNECDEAAYRLAKRQLAGRDIDILSESVGLKNLCLAHIITTGGGVRQIRDFYDHENGEKPYNLSMAERTMKMAKEIGLAE